jgi:hypothetical protein
MLHTLLLLLLVVFVALAVRAERADAVERAAARRAVGAGDGR